jgi:hypothetical protein
MPVRSISRDPFFAFAGGAAQFVEFFVEAVFDDAAFLERERGSFDDGAFDKVAEVGQGSDIGKKLCQQRRGDG